MPRTAEQRFRDYWKNPEKVREHNREDGYKKRGLPVPPKRKYTLRPIADRSAPAAPVAAEPARPARARAVRPAPVPVPVVETPASVDQPIRFTLTNDDFQ